MLTLATLINQAYQNSLHVGMIFLANGNTMRGRFTTIFSTYTSTSYYLMSICQKSIVSIPSFPPPRPPHIKIKCNDYLVIFSRIINGGTKTVALNKNFLQQDFKDELLKKFHCPGMGACCVLCRYFYQCSMCALNRYTIYNVCQPMSQ